MLESFSAALSARTALAAAAASAWSRAAVAAASCLRASATAWCACDSSERACSGQVGRIGRRKP
eukprot:365381-Chlamydomonas_euryale.AAC.20